MLVTEEDGLSLHFTEGPCSSTPEEELDTTHFTSGGISPQKWWAVGVLTGVSLLCGLLPYWTLHSRNTGGGKVRQTVVVFLSNASGGILLSTLFLHILPELRHKAHSSQKDTLDNQQSFSLLPEIFTLNGFCLIFFVEVAAGVLLPSHHNHTHRHFHQTGDCVDEEHIPSCERSRLRSDATLEDGHSAVLKSYEVEGNKAVWRVVASLLALSFHGIMEGVAVGLQGESELWMTFGAIASHKFLISFCIGVELVRVGASFRTTLTSLTSFAVVSPIGILVGSSATSLVETSLLVPVEGFACGTLLYVVFFDILSSSGSNVEGTDAHSRNHRSTPSPTSSASLCWRSLRVFMPFVGVSTGITLSICLISIIGGHSH